jgi:glycosyltransferase involved in cell wall biosynthesis
VKITWVDDNLFDENPTGGAEATNRSLVSICPYPVTELTPSLLEKKEQLIDNDLVIFGNIKRFSDEQVEWMLDCPVRMKYEHDYWNLVRPNQEQYKKELWEGCSVCIFHSPAHVETYSKMYPFQFKNIWLQPSYMDVDKMQPGEKEDITIYVGSITIHKGALDALTWCKANNIMLHVYGCCDGGGYYNQIVSHPNSIMCGILNYSELLKLYAKAKRFIFLPVWIDPFARVVVEARLSDCELVLNTKVGAMSYDWWNKNDKEYREILKEKANSFWNILDLL